MCWLKETSDGYSMWDIIAQTVWEIYNYTIYEFQIYIKNYAIGFRLQKS